MSIRKDYIERLVEQFAAALARLLKARQEKRFAEAAGLIRSTALDTLGMEYDALLMVDAASTSRMLGDPMRVKILARLVAEDGELHQDQGDPRTATARFHYALALYAESRALGRPHDDEDAAVLTRLRAFLGPAARA
ncbi:hypothetical protein [Myxococcus qinghaiensis]|uniref:hypothetical protein n=1 Tax=Myxococcus qinghaiensis TaxID=2906758 RepID=UPI0020A7544B|nr:hypothetical protein [Myxococcus qinghaiensis]MCP3166186.1 hypothetical protein [Myxococcus qinghaiensis]